MSTPLGTYTFAGLGFTGLRFEQEGGHWTGALSYGDSTTAITGATYTDATGVVTFSVDKSPGGISDLNFTGEIILDLSGNVIAIAGTWTGRSVIQAPVAAAPSAAATPAEAAAAQPTRGIGPIIPIIHAHGAWAAFNRQDLMM